MQRLTHVVFISLLLEETVPAVHVVNSRFCSYTTLVPRPMLVVFGLGMRLYVHVRTKSENGVLRNGQQTQRSLGTRPSKNQKGGSGKSAGMEMYTVPGMQAHFRLAFD